MAKRYHGSKGSGMLKGGGHANMPGNVVMSNWPPAFYPSAEGLNDTITGINKQIKDDSKFQKGSSGEKY